MTERDLMRFTTRDAEAVLGLDRPLTDDEYDHIVKTLEFAIPEVFEDVVRSCVTTHWCIAEWHDSACPQPCPSCEDECGPEYVVATADLPDEWKN